MTRLLSPYSRGLAALLLFAAVPAFPQPGSSRLDEGMPIPAAWSPTEAFDEVVLSGADDVVVSHRWEDLNDDRVTVTGTAMVTWSFADQTRRVVHELTWTRLSDGRSATGSGDRLQRSLEGGIFEGFGVDGTRAWEGESGTWTLGIDGVEMRWVDPVPQAGTYTLTTPESKTLSLGFSRVDGDTITVTISSGARSYDFDVTTLPAEE